MKILNSAMRFIAGEDIFVSYSRADAVTYAQSLANELSKRDFVCYLDQWGSQPGEELPAGLKLTLWRSTVLVVVGSTGATRSTAVRDEIEIFLKTKRTLIPISIDGALEQASWFAKVSGLALSKDSGNALLSGEPSESIVNRIDKSFQFSRRREKTRRAVYVTLGLIAVLLSLTGVAVALGLIKTARAQDQQRIAEGAKAQVLDEKGKIETSLNQSRGELTNTLTTLNSTKTELATTNTELSTQRIIAADAKDDADRALDLKARAEASAEQAIRVTHRRVWQEQASVAAADHRFDIAELALARAVEADPRGSKEVIPLYMAAREKRLLTPHTSLTLPLAQRLAELGSWNGYPYMVILNHDNNALYLNHRGTSTTIQPGCDSEPLIASKERFLIWACGKEIHSIRMNEPDVVKTALLDDSPTDLAFVGNDLRVVERLEGRSVVRTFDPEDLRKSNTNELAGRPEGGILRLCSGTQYIAYSINVAGTSFRVNRWTSQAEAPQTDEVLIPNPQGFSQAIGANVLGSWSAPGCGKFFITYSPGWSPSGPRAESVWAEIDLEFPVRVRTLDADIRTIVPVNSGSGLEAEYLMRTGDLRQLLAVSPIVIDTPIRTIARQVRAFAEWRASRSTPDVVTVVADDRYLTVFSGADIVVRYPIEVKDILKVAISDDGSFIAVEGDDRLVVWSKAPPNQDAMISSFDALSKELGIKWPEKGEPTYQFKN